MAVIASSNLVWYLSGGGTNTNPAASLGGAISSVTVTAGTIFDNVSGDEALAGDMEYRCVYIKNNDANATGWMNPIIWVSTDAPGPDNIYIALGGEGKNGTAETVGNEGTPPTGESFTQPTTKSGGLSLAVTMTQNEYYPVWIRRSVPASSTAYNSDGFTLSIEGDTSA